MRDLLAAFARSQARRNLSERTINGRHRLLVSFCASLDGRPLTEATRADVEEWLDGRDVGSRGRYNYISALHAFYAWAIDEEAAHADPTAKIHRPKTRRGLPRPMSDEDLEVALAAADDRMRAWLCLGSYQGFRCKEMAGLRREHVLDHRDPALLLVERGKGDKDAILPLNPLVESALRIYGLPSRGPVFRLRNGRAIQPATISVYIGRFLHGLGIRASAHNTRHFFGTEVYSLSGRDIRVTQEMLRHASSSSTAIYTAWDQPLAVEVVRKLGAQPRLNGHSRDQPRLFEV